MTEPDMIERVARAMHEAVLPNVPWVPEPGDGYYAPQFAAARAAIEAMREPTLTMYEAGEAADSEGGCTLNPTTIYRAMIDEALRPPHPVRDTSKEER